MWRGCSRRCGDSFERTTAGSDVPVIRYLRSALFRTDARRTPNLLAGRKVPNVSSWPMADYTGPDRNRSGYWGAAVIGERMGPTGS